MKKLLLLFTCVILFQISNGQNLTGKILFSRYNGTGPTPDSIFALNNDGKTLSFVTFGYRPRLSHNGKWMAFCNGPNPDNSYGANLWIRDLTRQKDTEIVQNSDYLDYYDFSPSDTKIVYSQECSVFTTNLDGSNSYHTVINWDCYTDDPTVRISDSMITYHDLHYGIYKMHFDGSGDSIIPHTYPRDLYPIWSPDQQWIAYEKNITTAADYILNNVYKIKPNGTDSTQLSFFPPTDTIVQDVVWAKDQQTLFFIGRISDTIGIYQLHTDGSGTYKRIFNLPNSGFVYYYWLGLADSIFTNKVVVNYCDSLSANFSYVKNGAPGEYDFTDLSKASQGFSLSWKWNFGDGTANGNNDTSAYNNPVHIFHQANTYNVCLTVKGIGSSDTCSSTKCMNVTATIDGVKNINDLNAFKLNPNPSDGNVQIILPGNLSGVSQYFITNILGEKVYEGNITSSTTKLTLNIPEGTYFVSVFNNQQQFTQRLVIQK